MEETTDRASEAQMKTWHKSFPQRWYDEVIRLHEAERGSQAIDGRRAFEIKKSGEPPESIVAGDYEIRGYVDQSRQLWRAKSLEAYREEHGIALAGSFCEEVPRDSVGRLVAVDPGIPYWEQSKEYRRLKARYRSGA